MNRSCFSIAFWCQKIKSIQKHSAAFVLCKNYEQVNLKKKKSTNLNEDLYVGAVFSLLCLSTRRHVQQANTAALLRGGCCHKHGRTSGEPATGSWCMRGVACTTQSKRWTGSDKKVSEYKGHHRLLCVGLHNLGPVRVPMLNPVHCQKRKQRAREPQNWTTEQREKVACSDESHFLLNDTDSWVPCLPGEYLEPDCTVERRECDALGSWETLDPAFHVDHFDLSHVS